MAELKEISRRYIGGMEFWLRRLTDAKLRSQYGPDYPNAMDPNNQPVTSAAIRNRVNQLRTDEPARYLKWVDALTLDNLIDIVCGNQYVIVFQAIFGAEFPHGAMQLRSFLEKVKDVRNRIDHLNPITVHHAEQAICYSNDIVEIIKEYYRINGMQQQFNVPTIVRCADSHGHVWERHQGSQPWYGWRIDDTTTYRPGDIITLEVEIDASFNPDQYDLVWSMRGGRNLDDFRNHTSLVVSLEEIDINQNWHIEATVIQHQNWHKHDGFDDLLHFHFAVLPPLV